MGAQKKKTGGLFFGEKKMHAVAAVTFHLKNVVDAVHYCESSVYTHF